MTPPLLLCRKKIDVLSGAGQMIVRQAAFFAAQHHDVTVCCERIGGAGRAALRGIAHLSQSTASRLLPSSRLRDTAYASRVLRRAAGRVLIDHGQDIAAADLCYVHNFLSPRHAPRIDNYPAGETRPWAPQSDRTVFVANSNMVRDALLEKFGLPRDRVLVAYPGHDTERFNPESRLQRRAPVRERLGVDRDRPLVGLVTSGDFRKRGLDRFLECLETLDRGDAGVRALVLGGRRPPAALADHPLYRRGVIVYQAVTDKPEDYLAALDLLLYPARYEEFGIVLLEAMAMGIPAVTSTAVGASELLATASGSLVIDAAEDSIAAYCRRTSEMLALGREAREKLAAALVSASAGATHDAHNRRILEAVEAIPGVR